MSFSPRCSSCCAAGTGKWDVVRDALGSKGDFVRRNAIILALAPPVIATAAGLYLAVAR